MRQINSDGIALLKHFEGLRLKAYKDSVGVLTIGYGHTGADVTDGQTISSLQAEFLLNLDLQRFEKGVDALLNKPVNDNQFSALVCLAYNIGLTNFSTSTLLKCVNKGWFDKAADEFGRWNHAGGQVLPGLTLRRKAERDLFMKEMDNGPRAA